MQKSRASHELKQERASYELDADRTEQLTGQSIFWTRCKQEDRASYELDADRRTEDLNLMQKIGEN